MTTYVVHLYVYVKADSQEQADGIAAAAGEHLMETFNDDGSVVEILHEVEPS